MNRARDIVEAETPRSLLRGAWDPDDLVISTLKKLGFEKAEDLTEKKNRWLMRQGDREFEVWSQQQKLPPHWNKGDSERRWFIEVWEDNPSGGGGKELAYDFYHLGDEAFVRMLSSLGLGRQWEASQDPRKVFKDLPRYEEDTEVSLRWLRFHVSRNIVNRVEIESGPPPPVAYGTAKLVVISEISQGYGNPSTYRRYWVDFSCKTVLAQTLRQWTNLQGAPLIVDGQPAGKIAYRNPVLTELATGVAEAVSPKDLLKQLGNPDVNEILRYAPDDFKEAHAAGKTAEWDPQQAEFADWVPTYDDDADSWYSYAYFPVFRTEDGKLIEEIHGVDQDGNHDFETEEEVGTKDWKQMRHDYYISRPVDYTDYYQWVVNSGKDPLNAIHVPIEKVEHKWIAGFSEEGGKLKLYGVRKLGGRRTGEKHELITDYAEIPQDVREYLLLKDDGTTDADVADVIREGGKKDKQGRWVIRFTVEQQNQPVDREQYLRQKAQEFLDQNE